MNYKGWGIVESHVQLNEFGWQIRDIRGAVMEQTLLKATKDSEDIYSEGTENKEGYSNNYTSL